MGANKDFQYVVVDLETTGLHADRHEIIEIGYQVIDANTFQPLSKWTTYVKPVTTNITSSHIHGIQASDLENAPSFGEIAEHLLAVFHGNKLVAHNGLGFDSRFLYAAFEKHGYSAELEMIDTLVLARKFLHLPTNKQQDLAAHFGIQQISAHRAGVDVEVLSQIFIQMMKDPKVRHHTYKNSPRICHITKLSPVTPQYQIPEPPSFGLATPAPPVSAPPVETSTTKEDLISSIYKMSELHKHKLVGINTVSNLLGWAGMLMSFGIALGSEDFLATLIFGFGLFLLGASIRVLIVNSKLKKIGVSRDGYRKFIASRRPKPSKKKTR